MLEDFPPPILSTSPSWATDASRAYQAMSNRDKEGGRAPEAAKPSPAGLPPAAPLGSRVGRKRGVQSPG